MSKSLRIWLDGNFPKNKRQHAGIIILIISMYCLLSELAMLYSLIIPIMGEVVGLF